MLKFSFKKDRLNFTAEWWTSEGAMSGVPESTDDLLGSLFENNADGAMDKILNMFDDYDRLF